MHRKDSAVTMAVVHRGAPGDIKGFADAFGVRTGMAAPTLLARKDDVKSAPQQHAPTLLSSADRDEVVVAAISNYQSISCASLLKMMLPLTYFLET